jgi:hypothetical protein
MTSSIKTTPFSGIERDFESIELETFSLRALSDAAGASPVHTGHAHVVCPLTSSNFLPQKCLPRMSDQILSLQER